MNKLAGWYIGDWIKIMFRPIYFYTFMEKGSWKDRSFTFLLLSGWILSFGLACVAFFAYVEPLLSVVVSGISGYKLLASGFVYILLCASFFSMIFLILGGLLAVVSVLAFAAAAWVLDRLAVRFGGKGSFEEMLKSIYYSSALFIVILLVPVIGIATKFRLLTFQNFLVGVNLILYIVLVYAWGLWSIAAKRNYGLSRKNSLASTFILVLLMLLLLLFATVKILPVLERWIT